MNLSIVIITKNEEHNIARCINSCKPLGAEVIVLDSGSTDSTKRIAETLEAKVVQVDWKGYGATKNMGAAMATNDWILSLDADEVLDETLQKGIPEALINEQGFAGYWLYRVLIFEGKKLFYGAYKNEKRLRLYRKSKMQWNENIVHETLDTIIKNADYPYGELQGSLLHYSYTSKEDMIERLEKYARLSAEKLASKSKFYRWLKLIFSPTITFLKNYIFRLGFLDGRLGFVLAAAQAGYILKKYSYSLQS